MDPAGPDFTPPAWCVAEVTHDERFTGGQLALTERAALVAALAHVCDLRLPPENE